MKKIVVCDAIHEVGFDILANQDGIEVVNAVKVPKNELGAVIADADVLITRSSTECDQAFVEQAKKLTALVRAGVGVDNVDIDFCSKKGIVVMNVPTANTIAAVEMTMCHLINSARKFVGAVNDLTQDKIWNREKWYGSELFGKTLGVIGFGNIGSRVAVRAMAFGMKVVAYDPYIEAVKATSTGATYTTNFDDILACDFITIHTPKNKETTNMIDQPQIDKMKDGVRLINCARGGLYNEEALFANLKSGKIAYAGIDVFVKEPGNTSPLLDLPNLSATAHLGANTLESQENIARQAVEAAIDAAKGICYPNALNLPIKTNELPQEIAPFVELVSKLGYFGAQILRKQIRGVTLEAEGEVSKFAESLLTFGLVGALKESMGENINYVNARFVAGENGIELQTATSHATNYTNKITLKLIANDEIFSISGVAFGEGEQRIVGINEFKTDFKPKGKMIVFKNKDIPGVIAQISSILAAQNINIADFRLGRGKGGEALAVVLVDEEISQSVLEKLAQVEACLRVQYAEI